ncbi:MAG: site-2 protease family protein [Rhizobiaceae bacterium]
MSATNWLPIGLLIIINLGLIWFLMAVPLGRRTVTVSKRVDAKSDLIWSAVFPFGSNALWDGAYMSVQAIDLCRADVEIAFDGRDGKPIRRTIELSDVVLGQTYTLRVVDDNSLHGSFWAHHLETVQLAPSGEETLVTVSETDHYRGAAFLVFRYFKNRRHLNALDEWAKTGSYQKRGLFETFPVQVGMAILSALILWPFFGLSTSGLMLSAVLTAVVVLHEAGHMFAFRAMGHRSARMIIIPFLGGLALGGRPYNSHFEVGFSALMGAGFSVFPVIAAISLYSPLQQAGFVSAAAVVGAFGTIGAIFNLGNLVPVWKFDGGQVIRQIFRTRLGQGLASFLLLGGLLAVGKAGGFSNQALVVVGIVFSLLSVVTSGTGVKPKFALVPMSAKERCLVFFGLLAAFGAHAAGAIWGFTFYLA